MSDDIALHIEHLYKDFKLPHEQKNSLKEYILRFHRARYEMFHVLKDIDIKIERGEFFGILGRNGSGKSTLLKLIGGIYQPTAGYVHVNGTLTPFIELGIGFNAELTGRENVFLNGPILGLTRKEVDAKYKEIVAFAEIENFMDQKLKNYSSGMQVRLAFSIAMQAHNDILLIDEVLAVGDAAFQKKCYDIFKKMKREKSKTVVFVTHDMGAVRDFCDRAILIEAGEIVSDGDPNNVANDYLALFNEQQVRTTTQNKNKRWGDYKLEIGEVSVNISQKNIDISYRITAKTQIKNPICGVIIKNADDIHVFDSNTKWKHVKTGILAPGEIKTLRWKIPNVFRDGSYRITVGAAHEDGLSFYDWQEDAATFNNHRTESTAGLLVLEDIISIT